MTLNLNPWALEFIPSAVQYTLPPRPSTFPIAPSTVNATSLISYNIFPPFQLHIVPPFQPHVNYVPQMNYIPAATSPPSFPLMGCPISFPPVNTFFARGRTMDPSNCLPNFSVCPPHEQQGLKGPPPKPHESRRLLLSSVPPQLTEEDLRRKMRSWGPIRALHLQRRYEGVVTVDYFDLRHANNALFDIQQRMAFLCYGPGMEEGRLVRAEYASPTAQNQGTLVLSNLDTTISPHTLISRFQRYGAVKEVRESPLNSRVKFIEFFDVRDASRALEALDETRIGSNPVKIFFSHLGSRALKGAAKLNNRPPRQQRFDNSKWSNGKQISCTHQTGVSNSKCKDNIRGETSVGGRATESVPNGERGSFHAQFAFDEDEALSNSAHARTTLMIKNIPNKYHLDMILELLDRHCMQCNEQITEANEPLSEYDFVYLPVDFKNRCNLGYAFVNFTFAKATWKFYKLFHNYHWTEFNSNKICEITYARLQGRRLLEDHFRNARLECDTDNFLPLVFDPPRNGQNLTVTKIIRSLPKDKNGSKIIDKGKGAGV